MNDLISRQAALDALERIFDRCEEIEAHLPDGDPDKTGYKMFPDYMTVWKYMRQLPSAEVTLCHLDSPCEYQNADIAMPSAQQWIPCSERQPEETNLYWVTVKPIDSEILEVTQRWYFGRGYGDGWEAELYEPPLAWMPMEWPEPWRGEEDDT